MDLFPYMILDGCRRFIKNPMATDLLGRIGLEDIHRVQNGLLLCKVCHGEFNELKRYVDVVDDKLVLKVVNESDDPTSDKFKKWKSIFSLLKSIRCSGQQE